MNGFWIQTGIIAVTTTSLIGLVTFPEKDCEVMNQLSTSRRHQYGYGYRDYDYGYYSSNEYARYYAEDDDASSGQA